MFNKKDLFERVDAVTQLGQHERIVTTQPAPGTLSITKERPLFGGACSMPLPGSHRALPTRLQIDQASKTITVQQQVGNFLPPIEIGEIKQSQNSKGETVYTEHYKFHNGFLPVIGRTLVRDHSGNLLQEIRMPWGETVRKPYTPDSSKYSVDSLLTGPDVFKPK